MYAIVYWDNFSQKYEIFGGLTDNAAVKARLARLSSCNPLFSGYVTTEENSQFVADYVNVAHSIQSAGGNYPWTIEQDEEFDGRFIGSVTYRRPSRGTVGNKTTNWKWTSGARWPK